MIFWRILNNKLYSVGDVDNLGFEKSEKTYIPDEYLEKQEFVIMRTCHGIGDWGILSAMPRLLKQKYPKCKVYLPSVGLLEQLFSNYQNNWSMWNNPFKNVENIFKNNPFIDGYLDEIKGEIFHDHYRIYDKNTPDIPLVEQILDFWQFSQPELKDSQPELYFSDDEKKQGDEIINTFTNGEYGVLLISNRYNYEADNLIVDKLKQNNLPYFYWTKDPIEQTKFNFINSVLNLRNIDIRIQLYIKSKAKLNIGSQAGINHLVVRYSDVYEVQRQFPLGGNFVKGETYLKDIDKQFLLKGLPDKWESKTTTTLRYKSEMIDFFRDKKYKNMTVLEIGSSNGHSTKVLSHLFKSVTAVDILKERHTYSQENYNKSNNNINYIVADVYNKPWNFGHHDIVFIDCVHDYPHVKSDIENTLKICNKPIIIFDDYGLFPDIKKAIDEYIDSGRFEVLTYVGHQKGTIIPKTQNKILKHFEGIICQVK
tara:strand:+ start:2489 stop:3931 length:1443 start_codon:yes stop_codon:yes gene_type:complete